MKPLRDEPVAQQLSIVLSELLKATYLLKDLVSQRETFSGKDLSNFKKSVKDVLENVKLYENKLRK